MTTKFSPTTIDGTDYETTAVITSFPEQGDESVLAPTEVRVLADGRAMACYAGDTDEVYPSLVELYEAHTMEMPQIKIRLDGDGMGEGATYADAQAYEAFVERRLGEMYPGHDITVTLAREGQTVPLTVELDDTEHQDVSISMARLWDEFCSDTTLWPSTRPLSATS